MIHPTRYENVVAGLVVMIVASVGVSETPSPLASERVRVGEDGRVTVTHDHFPEAHRNPWPAAEEKAFWDRVNHFLPHWKDAAAEPRQSLEGQGHDIAMLAWLAGDRERAEAWFVQPEMHMQDHRHTQGIDFYWGFTLKYRPHWYFMFRDTFPDAYRKKVYEGAKIWSASDPRPSLEYALLLDNPSAKVRAEAEKMMKAMWRDRVAVKQIIADARADKHPNRRAFADYLQKILPRWPEQMPQTPQQWYDWYALITTGDWKVYEEYERLVNPRPHPVHGIGSGPVGTQWTPQVRGGLADARNTDNLRAMREIAAYLFAEETGNETTRLVMKEKLRRVLISYYSVGMGEWDSSTYHPASANTWYGLHDYAKDPEVRLIAKGVLDYLWTISALKYRDAGGWGGPNCRDYGDWRAWRSGAAMSAYIYFGSLKNPPPAPTKSWVNQILSPYRPPMAVMALARKQFDKPCEILSSHPAYQTWLPGKTDAPETHATLFYGETYQIGTRVRGSFYNINGIKTLIDSADGNVTYLMTTGGKGNIVRANAGGDRIAQYRNLVLYLNGTDPKAPFRFATAPKAPYEFEDDVLFLNVHETYVAIRAIHLTFSKEAELDKNALGLKKRRKADPVKPMVIHATGDGSGAARGFAMELGDVHSHGSYEKFKAAVLASSKINVADAPEDMKPKVTFTGTSGATVALQLGDELPKVWRNGKLHEWAGHFDLYRPTTGDGPVRLGWKQGRLTVNAAGHRFNGKVDLAKGNYEFSNTPALSQTDEPSDGKK